ncbi:MAG: thymidylate kinase/thiamine kinase-like enzyme [Arenicella sp.]|jgi:thymidylate kinase/thiamine kinase-like enzyme
MRKNIALSDVELLLKLFAPDQFNLFISDPSNQIVEDLPHGLRKTQENAPAILVSMGNGITRHKSINLEDFEMIFDFGDSQIPKEFKRKDFAFQNNLNGTIRWFFTPGKFNSVLSFYNTSSLRSKIIGRAIKLVRLFGLERIIRSGKCTIYYKKALQLETALDQVKHDDYAVFTGTVGFDRKAVVALQLENRTTHFAKVALNRHGTELLIKERHNLKLMNRMAMHNIIVPKVIDVCNSNVMLITNEGNSSMKRSGRMLAQHIDALVELFDNSETIVAIEDTEFWRKTASNIKQIKEKNGIDNTTNIKRLLLQLKHTINPRSSVVCSLAHSDFTPWNMLVGEKKLYLFDWELAQNCAPVLYDLFHFHFQNGIMVKKHGFEEIMQSIKSASKHPSIQEIITENAIDIQLHLNLYLLQTVSYYMVNFQKQHLLSEGHKNQLVVWEKALKSSVVLSQTNSHRKVFVNEFYEALKLKKHALLKFEIGSLDRLAASSDLDIAVLKKDVSGMVSICKKHFLVERISTNKKSFMSTVELFFKDGSFLSIDLIHQFKRKNVQMMEMSQLLNSAKPNKHGFFVPEKRFDMEYALLFYTLNNARIPHKYYSYFEGENEQSRYKTFCYLNLKYALNFDCYGQLFVASTTSRKAISDTVARQSFSSASQKLRDNCNYVLDTARFFVSSRGFIVTLSGVDGVGKSTIVQEVKTEIKKRHRKEVVLLRHRPGILPILSSIRHGSVKKAEQVASVTKPRMGRNKGTISSLFRFGYYYLDYIIGQVYVYFKYVLRNKIVLYDRYYFDFIADSKRSNINLDKRLIKLLYFFVLKPRLNILLWADPLEVYRRKQELDPETVYELTSDYRILFGDYSRKYRKSTYRTIKNVKVDHTVEAIMEEFMKVA